MGREARWAMQDRQEAALLDLAATVEMPAEARAEFDEFMDATEYELAALTLASVMNREPIAA